MLLQKKAPLIEGNSIPDFWCKNVDGEYYIFISHPMAQNLHFPISYGQSFTRNLIFKQLTINVNQKKIPIDLIFKPNQSVLLKITKNGAVEFMDINYEPPIPVVK